MEDHLKRWNEYSEPIKKLEELLKEEAKGEITHFAGGMWVRRVEQRRGSRTVGIFFFPAGLEIPLHEHEQTEVLVFTEGGGCYRNASTGVEFSVGVGDHISVPPDTAHTFKANVDTYGVVVMIPSTEAFGK